MSQSADTEALTAWADALRNGLGRVRFGDLPDEEFERILGAVPADDVDTLVVFAENASLSGLESIESSGPQVPEVRRAITLRRAQLENPAESTLIAFPGRPDISEAQAAAAPRRRGLFQRLVMLFAEPATGYDEVPGEAADHTPARQAAKPIR